MFSKLNLLLLLFLSLVGAHRVYAQSLSPDLLVMVYGDILTLNTNLQPSQTFPAQLEKKLRTAGFEARVVHVGERELTSVRAIEKLPFLIGKSPDIMILQIGETDMRRNLNPRAINENLHKIIDVLREKSIYVVVMGAKPPAANGKEYADQIEGKYKELSSTVSVYPYTLQGIVGNEGLTVADGYHPNAKGVEFMVNNIYRMVDTGLRWRLQVINQIRAKQQMQMR